MIANRHHLVALFSMIFTNFLFFGKDWCILHLTLVTGDVGAYAHTVLERKGQWQLIIISWRIVATTIDSSTYRYSNSYLQIIYGLSMKYKDYKKAARKHMNTCEVLEDRLKQISNNTELRKSLILNAYYLSGYVIECIVKYGIYDRIGFDKDKDITTLNNGKLTYDQNIRHHRFERYTEHLVKYITRPIPLISNTTDIDKDVVRLFKEWDVIVRYKYDLGSIHERHYLAFCNISREIFRIVSDNTRG